MRHIFHLAFGLILLAACTEAPDFKDEPEISFLGILNNDLAQSIAFDTVLIQVSVTDAQGDLGGLGKPTVYMIDKRDDFVAATFELPNIEKQGSANGIEADVTLFHRVVKGDVCCRYPDGTGGCVPSIVYPIDTLFYDIYFVDHAGHESNRIEVGPIFLACD